MPMARGELGVKYFLESLATRDRVTASTENQAFSALLFLFRYVWKLRLDNGESGLRARRSETLPTVLSAQETQSILEAAVRDGSGLVTRELGPAPSH